MFSEFPKEVRIENTNRCNAVCTMCPRELLKRGIGTMSTEFFNSIADQLKAGGTEELHLQGYGEPFLDKGILEKIRYAKEIGIPYTFMVTNASIMDEEVCEGIVKSGLDKLKISFYGINPEEYETVHKGLSYEKVQENVKRLLSVKKRLKSKTPVVDVKYIGSLPKFLIFALQWGLKTRISYARLHNYADGRSYNKPRKERQSRSCVMVREPVMQVLWDGKVVPCCYDFDGKMILGDLSKTTVTGVWNGKEYNEFRRIHRDQEFDKLPLCLNCDKLK